jgi:hypothetical protein
MNRDQYILEHTDFYLKSFRRLLGISLILMALVLIMIAFILYQNFTRPQPKYFATTIDGRLIEIKPLNQ